MAGKCGRTWAVPTSYTPEIQLPLSMSLRVAMSTPLHNRRRADTSCKQTRTAGDAQFLGHSDCHKLPDRRDKIVLSGILILRAVHVYPLAIGSQQVLGRITDQYQINTAAFRLNTSTTRKAAVRRLGTGIHSFSHAMRMADVLTRRDGPRNLSCIPELAGRKF